MEGVAEIEMTHNSWIILSKLMTAKRREAMPAAEISPRATIRSSEAVFATVVAETFEGSGYAVGMTSVLGKEDGWSTVGRREIQLARKTSTCKFCARDGYLVKQTPR
jgi:hypothetical protein